MQEKNLDIPPQQVIMQALSGFIFSMAIKSALELDLFNALKKSICTLDKMAVSLEVNAAALKRLLKVLCSIGLVYESQPNQYSVTAAGATLQESTTPGTLEPIVRYMLSERIVLPMTEMSYSIRTGKPSFDKIMSKGWYDHSQENSQELAIMDKAMETYSKISLPDILAVYPFTHYNVIVDIAGGMGQMLAGMLNLNNQAKGILFDKPETIERAKDYIKSIGLSERCQLCAGDMFEKVPSGGDLYVISKALNDWDDEHVIRVLRNVRTAMDNSSKLILIEQIANGEIPSAEECARDLIFLVCTQGGAVRTQADFTKLISAAGLKIANVIVSKSGFSLVECTL